MAMESEEVSLLGSLRVAFFEGISVRVFRDAKSSKRKNISFTGVKKNQIRGSYLPALLIDAPPSTSEKS